MDMITSTSNARIKRVRALQSDRRARAAEGVFVVEGPRLLREALLAGVSPDLTLYTEDFAAAEGGAALLDQLDGPVLVSEAVMKAASDTPSPQGVLAVVPVPSHAFPPDLDFALVVDRLQNPGNLGAILRTADAAGVPGVWLAPGTVDPTNPKVVRGAAGAHFRLPLQVAPDWESIRETLAGLTVYLADADGGVFYDRVNWRRPSALVVGSEAHGAGREAASLARARVTIPMLGGAESLNAAVATGILLFEVARQRSSP
jgi:TrmH family RNA methyltransferase